MHALLQACASPPVGVHASPSGVCAPFHPCEPFPQACMSPEVCTPPPTRIRLLAAVRASPPPVCASCMRPPFIQARLHFIRVYPYFIYACPTSQPYGPLLHPCAPATKPCALQSLQYNRSFYLASQRGNDVAATVDKVTSVLPC
jgi:hypothetical protein